MSPSDHELQLLAELQEMAPFNSAEPVMNRRSFLRRGSAGALGLSAVSLLPGCAGNYPAAEAELKVFSDKEFFVLQSIMETFLPVTQPDELDIREASAAERLDDLLALAPTRMQDQLKMLILIFEHGTLPLAGKFSRFSKLSPAERSEVLNSLRNGDNSLSKILFTAFLKISFGMYYESELTHELLGYPGPLRTRPGAPQPIGNSTLTHRHPTPTQPGPLRIPGEDTAT
ncbi:MAG: hypothetical protein JRC77_03670 [Deltaproteobacteria bacterium]|nr:hypothetical protein [Deltaproteobacteria bacterium]